MNNTHETLSLVSSLDIQFFHPKSASVAASASFAAISAGMPVEAQAASNMWAPVPLPFEDTLFDIDFDRYVGHCSVDHHV